MSSGPDIQIQTAGAADLPALRSIYAGSVRALAPACYSAEQVQAWAGFADDPEFRGFILNALTWIAWDRTTHSPLGFCGLRDDGHVVSLYVAAHQTRRGIGSALLRHALEQCPTPTSGRWFAQASRLSRPVFERFGFRLVGLEQSERDGILFTREQMERRP